MMKKTNNINLGLLVLTFLVLSSTETLAEEIQIKKIIQIESSGDPLAWNRGEDARGLMQIRSGALADWNRLHRTDRHTKDDLWDPQINVKIGSWYINVCIPRYLRHFNIPDTYQNRIVAYNAGIGTLRKGKKLTQTTKDYIRKYKND